MNYPEKLLKSENHSTLTSGKLSNGTSVQRPDARSGWSSQKNSILTRVKKLRRMPTSNASDILKTNGSAVDPCGVGSPKAYADEPIYVFETGGSTGVPKSRISIRDFHIDYEIFSESLSDEGFPPGSDWLMLGPTGPRRLRLAVEHLAQHRGGICFHVDLDPRWVNQLVRYGKNEELDAYKNHVISQALNVLRAHENVQCLFTTPKLLEALCEKISLPKVGIKGIFCGGTEMDAQFHRFAREELVPGIDFIPTYGNTLMGLAACKPFDPADNYAIIYYPPQPRAVIELVNPEKSGGTCRLRRNRTRHAHNPNERIFHAPFSGTGRSRTRRADSRIPLGRC